MDRAASIQEGRQGGFLGFVGEAASAIFRHPVLVPALLLLVVLTGSNIVVLLNLPQPGSPPPAPFLLAAVVRIAGLIYLSSVILRLGAPSERPAWRPDAGFWLYALGIVASIALSAGIGILLGKDTDPAGLALKNVVSTLFLAPFAVWFVGMTVARPLGWRPGRFMRDFGRWLPPLLIWSLVLITPIAVLHAVIDLRLIEGVGELFWPLALFDGALSTVIALIGFGLNLAAYRRVAPD